MVKVRSLRAAKLRYALPSSVSITGHSLLSQDHIILTLESSDGVTGIGEASPFPAITGDSMDQVIKELFEITASALPSFNTAREFYDAWVSQLQCASLRCAFDSAAHDLQGKMQGVSVGSLYRASPRLTPNSVTVFLKKDNKESASTAADFLRRYPHLSILKIKLSGESDFERCAAIKAICPDSLKFVLDANQGYLNEETAVRELNKICSLLKNVVAIEEPCPKGDLRKLKFVSDNVEGPLVLADETCCSLSDLNQIIDHRAARGINIKLQKAGGITPARELSAAAAAAGLQTMVGQMFESPLSTSAAVHFATSSEGVLLTDLDMDLPYPEALCRKSEFSSGVRRPIQSPGLGINFSFAPMPEITWNSLP